MTSTNLGCPFLAVFRDMGLHTVRSLVRSDLLRNSKAPLVRRGSNNCQSVRYLPKHHNHNIIDQVGQSRASEAT